GEAEIARDGVGPDVTIDRSRLPPPIPRGSVVVAVVDARDGSPIQDFKFQYSRARADHPEPEWGGTSGMRVANPAGRILVEKLAIGRYEVLASANGFAARTAWIDVAENTEPSKLRLELAVADARIDGHVVDKDGAPLALAEVTLVTSEGGLALADSRVATR